jgi:NAD(P)-dependent dehydrogenase (short-subunit alcohol dehydrogenase family)
VEEKFHLAQNYMKVTSFGGRDAPFLARMPLLLGMSTTTHESSPTHPQQHRVAVVTGVSRGIGREIAGLLLAQGWVVYGCARRSSQDLEWSDDTGRLHYASADLSTEAGCQGWIDFVTQHCDRVDMLVHNAGSFVADTLMDAPAGQLEGQMSLHVYSAYRLSRALHPLLKKSDRPYVFTLCSVASLRAYPGGASYCISKFALLGFTKMLRQEWIQEGIAVSAILPGAVYTDSWSASPWPQERLMPPADVASAILHAYAASPRTVFEEILLRPFQGDL